MKRERPKSVSLMSGVGWPRSGSAVRRISVIVEMLDGKKRINHLAPEAYFLALYPYVPTRRRASNRQPS